MTGGVDGDGASHNWSMIMEATGVIKSLPGSKHTIHVYGQGNIN